ncbi:hypothetical protein NDU88_002905 [Pleurodeles waltl]|uniref:Uncharacterized protein n=1 Tax=Pleurodeles waltl TaxID=8319 RepID=A0AAV7VFX6_PLEWA|nr:hypothetical protein NDU88_002905 [Pleurodeles waltl]
MPPSPQVLVHRLMEEREEGSREEEAWRNKERDGETSRGRRVLVGPEKKLFSFCSNDKEQRIELEAIGIPNPDNQKSAETQN